jgi:DNA-binding response OmpR family regulator
MLRSMAFALEAHGYRVEQYAAWKAAEAAASRAFCLVVDGDLATAELETCFALRDRGVAVVVLAEDEADFAHQPGLKVLNKPLSGADLVAAVAAIRRNP